MCALIKNWEPGLIFINEKRLRRAFLVIGLQGYQPRLNLKRLKHKKLFALINTFANYLQRSFIMSFIYIWHDCVRNMFYVGSHDGNIDDGYLSSSRWLNGEINYRPADFRRKIIKYVNIENLKLEEYRYISMIKEQEYGVKYYNLKQGAKKGNAPWNKGKNNIYSGETIKKMSEARLGKSSWNKGMNNPQAVINGRKGAAKQSATVKGRKKVVRDGKLTWAYPGDFDYPNKKGV